MNIFQIFILAVVQGIAELLPVSSSAHVILAGRFFGFNPSSPEGTFLLVMLHTGTMFAVILYFWPRWRAIARESMASRLAFAKQLLIATAVTGVLGFGLKGLLEKFVIGGENAEIEHLFHRLPLIAASLVAVGTFIIFAGTRRPEGGTLPLNSARAAWIGAVQGLCLPFRGFSRSGATISTGLLLGIPRSLAEDFSFALAVILTPPVIVRQVLRLMKQSMGGGLHLAELMPLLAPGLLGMVFSFVAGLFALKWLSGWLEQGRWKLFGYYCYFAAAMVLLVHFSGK